MTQAEDRTRAQAAPTVVTLPEEIAISSIRVLCRAHQEAISRGTELRFIIAQPGVLRVLQISGADQILPIYPTLHSAQAGNTAPR
jgi:hypothetical protein